MTTKEWESTITIEELRDVFDYNPSDGVLRWKKKTSNKVVIGKVAGGICQQGYIKVRYKKVLVFAHRVVFAIVHGRFPDFQIDHLDHNRTNNKIDNLREVTAAENRMNVGLLSNNTTGSCGVTFCRRSNKWEARITINKKTKHIGYYKTMDEAASARKDAERSLGFHKNHGTKVVEAK